MDTEWSVVYKGLSHRESNDRALVLLSLNIPYQLVSEEKSTLLVVPAPMAEKAKFELWQYEQENRDSKMPQKSPLPAAQNALPGVAAYVFVVCLVAWLAGNSALGFDWLAAGRVDGELIRNGEWWRSVTALTLHSGMRHLLGNIAFGVFFGLLAGRLIGSGVTWLAVVLSGAAANVLNVLLLESTHRSIGASTAVFATLGLVAGFVWRSKLMAQDRWAYRLGPIVGGMALLAYTGTGDENTDVGAHVTGFACGFAGGMLLSTFRLDISDRRWQLGGGLLAAAIVAGAWLLAL